METPPADYDGAWKETLELYWRPFMELCYRLIDWQMALPGPLEIAFQKEVVELEKEQVMPYVTSIERLGREEGLKLGRQEGIQVGLQEGIQLGRKEGIQSGRQDGRVEAAREAIEEALRIRFGESPNAVTRTLAEASDLEVLRKWHRLAITAPSLEVFVEGIAPAGERR